MVINVFIVIAIILSFIPLKRKDNKIYAFGFETVLYWLIYTILFITKCVYLKDFDVLNLGLYSLTISSTILLKTLIYKRRIQNILHKNGYRIMIILPNEFLLEHESNPCLSIKYSYSYLVFDISDLNHLYRLHSVVHNKPITAKIKKLIRDIRRVI